MPDFSDAAVHKLARDILARPEYAVAAKSPEPTLVQWLRRLLQWVGKLELLHHSAPGLYWMIIALLGLVTIGLLAHVIYVLSVALRQAQEPPAAPTVEPPPDPAAQAAALAANGRYLEAAHRLMIASLRVLAERSVIELRPDRPNRWIRAALGRSSLAKNLAAEIVALIDRTERRWFGDRENDPVIYEQWRSAFKRLSAAA